MRRRIELSSVVLIGVSRREFPNTKRPLIPLLLLLPLLPGGPFSNYMSSGEGAGGGGGEIPITRNSNGQRVESVSLSEMGLPWTSDSDQWEEEKKKNEM